MFGTRYHAAIVDDPATKETIPHGDGRFGSTGAVRLLALPLTNGVWRK